MDGGARFSRRKDGLRSEEGERESWELASIATLFAERAHFVKYVHINAATAEEDKDKGKK